MAVKTEDGVEYPASAFAYVPDPDKPSTWKLRLWDSLEEKETKRQVGMAVAALGTSGFRGNRVKIPSEDLPKVKRRVLQAWLKVNSDKERADAPRVLKHTIAEVFEDESLLNPNRKAPQRFNPDINIFEDIPNPNYMSQEEALLTGDNSYWSEEGNEEVGYQDEMTLLLRQVLQTWLKAHSDEGVSMMLKGYGDEEKGHGYGETAEGVDAMTHLLMAYRLMMDHEDCWPLLKPLMKLIHLLEEKMLIEDEEEEVYIEEGSGSYGRRRRRRMAKIITLEDGQYCVRSEETGRSFGCYETEAMAEARLAQIESFASSKLADAPTDALTKWYAQSFNVDPMSPSLKTVQELINDELVARSDRINTLEKAHSDSLPLMKQEEERYTLGPVYVPGVEDAHGEFTDERTLQKALWNWVKKDNRSIYLQHTDKVAGEMVEMLTWPFEVETNLTVPNQGVTKYKFPADTPFMGVVWEDWAWELIKAGELRGYSIGGMARRLEANLPEAA